MPRAGGKGHGEAERLPRGPLSVLKNFAEGGACRTREEDPQCSRNVSPPPGHECVVLSSVALQAVSVGCTEEKTWDWATSPFPSPEQNSGQMAQAGRAWHLSRLEHWLCTLGNVSNPGFQTTGRRSGRRKDSALLPVFPYPTLASANTVAWVEREPPRPAFQVNLPEPVL